MSWSQELLDTEKRRLNKHLEEQHGGGFVEEGWFYSEVAAEHRAAHEEGADHDLNEF